MIFGKKKSEGKKAAGGKKPKAKKEAAKSAVVSGNARVGDYGVLLSPVFTEKSSMVGGQSAATSGPTVVFRVKPDSTKEEIRGAVERVFNVEVAGVRTCAYIGKVKRTMRSTGRRAGYKKAYITLKQGHSISVVEGL
ncbi:MAG: 50S ribosomal protein L23 [Deltaproteobacteria bacterium]|nr:50S ribosomal protein L23 [Deltaproteobacteria bacterium]